MLLQLSLSLLPVVLRVFQHARMLNNKLHKRPEGATEGQSCIAASINRGHGCSSRPALGLPLLRQRQDVLLHLGWRGAADGAESTIRSARLVRVEPHTKTACVAASWNICSTCSAVRTRQFAADCNGYRFAFLGGQNGNRIVSACLAALPRNGNQCRPAHHGKDSRVPTLLVFVEPHTKVVRVAPFGGVCPAPARVVHLEGAAQRQSCCLAIFDRLHCDTSLGACCITLW